MSANTQEGFKAIALGAENKAVEAITKLDPEYSKYLKGIYVDATFGRDGALPRKTKELIMVGITCAINRPRGVKLHSQRALQLGATPKEILETMEVAARRHGQRWHEVSSREQWAATMRAPPDPAPRVLIPPIGACTNLNVHVPTAFNLAPL